MRKSILLPLMAIIAVLASCSPLKIAMDSRSPEGDRLVLTSDKHLFGEMFVALGSKISKKDTVYAILITSEVSSDHGIFDKNDKLMIRLDDETVITLYNLYHKEFEKEQHTQVERGYASAFGYGCVAFDPMIDAVYLTPYEIGTFVPRVTTYTTTRSYALYSISPRQLKSIMDHEVVKLRVEIEDSDLDMPDTGKVSQMFRDEFACLHERIKRPVERSEF